MALPRIKKNPYADVDVLAFDAASKMSRKELMQMGDIAHQQGKPNAALKWKSIAVEKQRVEENKAAMEKQFDAFKPHETPAHGAPILAPMTAEWQGDTEYRRLQDKWRQAQAKADAGPDFGPDQVTLQNAALTAREKMAEREQVIKAELSESGAFTQADQRTLDAQASLREKAAQVEAQVKGS